MPSKKKNAENALNVVKTVLCSPKKAVKRVISAVTPSTSRRTSKRLRKENLTVPGTEGSRNVSQTTEDVFLAPLIIPMPAGPLRVKFRVNEPQQPVMSAPETFSYTQHLPSAHPTLWKRAKLDAFDDTASTATFPPPKPPQMFVPDNEVESLAPPRIVLTRVDINEEEDNAEEEENDDEIVRPEDDELCALAPGEFPREGYPRPAPPGDFQNTIDEQEFRRTKHTAPNVTNASAALIDLNRMLLGERRGPNSKGYKALEFDQFVLVRLQGMRTLLSLYTNPNITTTYQRWGEAAKAAAASVGRGAYCARRLAKLARGFIRDRKVLPVNPYGKWTLSMISDEDLARDVREYLLQLGENKTAEQLVEYLSRPDVMEKHEIAEPVSLRTAQRYLDELGYTFSLAKKGQYADGHEREDVVHYRDREYLPKMKAFTDRSISFEADGTLVLPILPSDARRRVVIWYHDESIFYAHDRRMKTWRLRDAGAKPYKKGDGHSFMVADYVSADFGWLRGANGESARRTMRPGKNKDGYFTSIEVEEQALTACSIVTARWPEFEHIFVYDNATTHKKRSVGALSAMGMPKFISGFVSEKAKAKAAKKAEKELRERERAEEDEVDDGMDEVDTAAQALPNVDALANGKGKKARKPRAKPEDVNFLVTIFERNPLDNSVIHDVHGDPVKKFIQMEGAQFLDGTPQSLYLPPTHEEYPGKFKGMLAVLEERRERGDLAALGIKITEEQLKKLRSQCDNFKCEDSTSHTCCMRRMLYNQPDFAAVKSCLETACTPFGITIIFLPKFHPELNPIEMCWGYAKRVYRLNPESGREDILEKNALAALDSVPLVSIQRFFRRAHRFADAYRHGLDGAQAAWACKKFKGHRRLPPEYMEEIRAAGIQRGGNAVVCDPVVPFNEE